MKKIFLAAVIVFSCSCSLFSKEPEEKVIAEVKQIPESEIIQKAERAYQNGMVRLSRKHWQELKDLYPTSYYAPLAEIKIADSYYLNKDFNEAIGNYENFLRVYPDHEAAAYALFQIANSQIKQYRKSSLDQAPLKTAIETLDRLKKSYASSPYSKKADSLIANCKEGLARHELTVAKFYTKQKEFRSAANRIRYLQATFPNSKSSKTALKQIKEAYPEEFPGLKSALKNQMKQNT